MLPNPRILLLVPPFTDTNSTYASVTHLAGYLRARGEQAVSADVGIEVLDRLLSASGIEALAERARGTGVVDPGIDWQAHASVIDAVMRFLRGDDPSLALLLARGDWLPDHSERGAQRPCEVPGWSPEGDARVAASSFLRRIADLYRTYDDDRFELEAFGAELVGRTSSFAELQQRLAARRTLVTRAIETVVADHLERLEPAVVGISAPFTGTVCGALEAAAAVRRQCPTAVLVLGGGYVNTELRNLDDDALFEIFDYVTLDDGYVPLERIIRRSQYPGWAKSPSLERTFAHEDGQVRWHPGSGVHTRHAEAGAPSYAGIDQGPYFGLVDVPNVVHRLWSDWQWNKITVAQGCYWRRCTFCDVHLDYVGRYERAPAERTVDWMEALIAETGRSAFHFVDEAAPPAALAHISRELMRRGLATTWWGNIRFERAFTPPVVELLASAGCVAVTGGLEVPVDRLLVDMRKGITLAQAIRTMSTFTERGVLVHAYLMYGFPGETLQDIIDGAEVIRQLFMAGILANAHWHRFSLTRHSPLGQLHLAMDPTLPARPGLGDLELDGPPGDNLDLAAIGRGLTASLTAYKRGMAVDVPVTEWFVGALPHPTVAADYVDAVTASTA